MTDALDDPLRAAIMLNRAGWEVTLAPAVKKSPPVPGTTGKGAHSVLSDADLATWISEGYSNVGLVMPPGVIGLDIDHYVGDSGREKVGGNTIIDLEHCAGTLPATWRSTSRVDDPISGIRFYRLPGTLEGRESEGFGGGLPDIEYIRCEHRYAIVEPSVHPSGDPYLWSGPDGEGSAPAVADLPHLTHDHVRHLRRQCSCTFPSMTGAAPANSIDGAFHSSRYVDVADAINTFCDALENPGGQSRHDVMVSMVGRLVHDGVIDKDIHAQLRELYVEAVHIDRGSRSAAESEYNRAGKSALDKGFHLKAPTPADEHEPEPNTMPSRFATIDEVENLPPVRWHIENLIPEQSLVVMYGPPGSYKSFLAISLALSLDTGFDFLGHRVSTTARPLYIVGEGFHGIGARTRAWRKHWSPKETPDAIFHNGAINLASRNAVDELIEHIGNLHIGFVVFDTLARCTLGVEENSASEMGQVIANADLIRSETKATVMLVHHSGKDSTKGSRGSSAIKGAADAELEVVKGRLIVEKMKDGPEERPTFFEMVAKPDFAGSSIVPVVTMTAPTSDEPHGRAEPSVMEDLAAITEFLEGESGPMPLDTIYRNVTGREARLKGTVDTCVARGLLTETLGPRRARLIGLPE